MRICAQICLYLQQQVQQGALQQQPDAETRQRLLAQLGSRAGVMLKPGLQYDGFGSGNGITQQDAAMAAAALHNQNPVGLSVEGQQQQEQQCLIAELVSCSPSVISSNNTALAANAMQISACVTGSTSSTCMHKAAMSASRTAWLFEVKAISVLLQQRCDYGLVF